MSRLSFPNLPLPVCSAKEVFCYILGQAPRAVQRWWCVARMSEWCVRCVARCTVCQIGNARRLPRKRLFTSGKLSAVSLKLVFDNQIPPTVHSWGAGGGRRGPWKAERLLKQGPYRLSINRQAEAKKLKERGREGESRHSEGIWPVIAAKKTEGWMALIERRACNC